MKILLLQDYLRSGGTERQSVLLANAFAAAGHATTLLTFRPGGALAGTVASAVTRQVLQPLDTRLDWFAPGLCRTVRRIAPDIVLCMGRMANCHAGGLQKHLPRTTVIATMRTGKKLPLLYRRSLRLVRHIVANSHDAARVLAASYAVPPEKISVIHNSLVFPSGPTDETGDATPLSRFAPAIATSSAPASAIPHSPLPTPHFNPSDLQTFRPADVSLRAHHGATPATTVLLCVAMFRPEKNQRFLVELAARLPRDADWQLWLAGEGEARSACERLAAELNLGARIKFLGFVADPAPLYRAADVAVLASQSESLPNFLIEAQAHGLPVVACDVGGVRECFLPGETGWAVPPGDTAAFLAALTPLLAAPAHRAALAPKARAFARENFSPARQTQHYLDLFGRLIL
jgi:glycosyltransferase involved in cell wall biosynthesis